MQNSGKQGSLAAYRKTKNSRDLLGRGPDPNIPNPPQTGQSSPLAPREAFVRQSVRKQEMPGLSRNAIIELET